MYPLKAQNTEPSNSQTNDDHHNMSGDFVPQWPDAVGLEQSAYTNASIFSEKPLLSDSRRDSGSESRPNAPIFPEEPLPLPPLASPTIGQRVFGAAREVVETIVPAVIIALLINLFLAQATRVFGQSMEPNLHSNQRLVVEKVSYTFQTPERQDVVVLKVHEKAQDMLIKRVIALPGETVAIRDGQVLVNDQILEEDYLTQPTRGIYGPTTVPPDHVFVLGDNRGASNDSRSFGPISLENIIGKAWLSYWPVEEIGFVH